MYHNHRSEPWNSVILKQLLKEPGESVYQLIITILNVPYIFLNRFWYSKITATS